MMLTWNTRSGTLKCIFKNISQIDQKKCCQVAKPAVIPSKSPKYCAK